MPQTLSAPSLADIRGARTRITGIASRTPLVRLELEDFPGELYLKLENLQPIGSFKLRGAANAMALAGPKAIANGVYTASAGNMAQGVAFCARKMGVPCSVIVPERAPQTKIDAIERLGGKVIKAPFDDWWQAMLDHHYPGVDGLFVHPFADTAVMAGGGTAGLEVLDDLSEVDVVLVPWGGGGLACGIAAAAKAVNPAVRVYAVEVETSTPLATSLLNGKASTVVPTPSFVDGIAGKSVADAMFPLAQALIDDVLVVTLEQICDAIRILAQRSRVVAEGAGAAALAAALNHPLKAERVACIVSGGNIDPAKLSTILAGGTP